MNTDPEKERKIGIWGIGEPLGATIAETLVRQGVSPSSIVGIYTQRTPWVEEMRQLGIELHQEPQTPKSLTGLPAERVFERFIFLPTSDQSPRSLQGAVTRYLAKSVGDSRQVRHFYYVGPIYDSSSFFPSQSVYPAMESAIQTKAHVFTILRHSLLLDDVFGLEWLARTLRDGAFPLLRGTSGFNFCRVEDVAQAVVSTLSSTALPPSFYRWDDEAGMGVKAQFNLPATLQFSPKDVVQMVQKYFGTSVRWSYVEAAEAEQILKRRGISYRKRYDNSTDACNSLLMMRPDLYRTQSRQMLDLVGEEGFDTLGNYFADLKRDYEAYIRDKLSKVAREHSLEIYTYQEAAILAMSTTNDPLLEHNVSQMVKDDRSNDKVSRELGLLSTQAEGGEASARPAQPTRRPRAEREPSAEGAEARPRYERPARAEREPSAEGAEARPRYERPARPEREPSAEGAEARPRYERPARAEREPSAEGAEPRPRYERPARAEREPSAEAVSQGEALPRPEAQPQSTPAPDDASHTI